ncbi:hypothetical protein EET67_09685 [Pseudaminobacter arsenicus]|uniref:Uncharacterized protein n=1 Tax=Borborobacter arsenicus TaxID=1851146 RepID=A0A432V6U6_9HYPH|nr:hypothetical protein [Pseudaminobacter arsenicus]RUM97881.1 hypothetical protein EET67_09685 [Pseudaminobacter arsenicus]
MTDRPILFSAPMVRALLDGRKTQTRRVIDFPGIEKVLEFVSVATDQQGRRVYEMKDAAGEFVTRPAGKHFAEYQFWPKYAVGDRLWVREAWAPLDALTHSDPGVQALADRGFYRADDSTVEGEISRWRPGIHMPRWASRLTLNVTDVRVQRVQVIGEADAVAEGAIVPSKTGPHYTALDAPFGKRRVGTSAYNLFRQVWNDINAARGFGWEANPWVVAVTFAVERRNIDQVRP